jgi:hypothetical protein
MAILPTSTAAKGAVFNVVDNNTQGLHWGSKSDLRGNINNPLITGQCSKHIKTIVLNVSGPSGFKRTLSSNCLNGEFLFNITGDYLLPANGLYELHFSALDSNDALMMGAAKPFTRTYDLFISDLGPAILNSNFVFVSALPWGQNSTCNDPGYENQGCIQRMTWSAFHNAYDDPNDPDYDSDFFMKASDEPAKGWLHWGLIGQLRNLFNSDFDP